MTTVTLEKRGITVSGSSFCEMTYAFSTSSEFFCSTCMVRSSPCKIFSASSSEWAHKLRHIDFLLADNSLRCRSCLRFFRHSFLRNGFCRILRSVSEQTAKLQGQNTITTATMTMAAATPRPVGIFSSPVASSSTLFFSVPSSRCPSDHTRFSRSRRSLRAHGSLYRL